MELLQSELALIEHYDSIDFAAFESLGFGPNGGSATKNGAAAAAPTPRAESDQGA